MSTIKSSAEHLTLNADGASKDIKFQANGVEKASISSSGAFTSTTIDATALTGNLPAVNGSALTNLTAANLTGALPAISGASLTGLTSAQMPTGSVINVYRAAPTGNASGAVDSTWYDSPISITFTPTNASSTFVVWYNVGVFEEDNTGDGGSSLRLKRVQSSTTIYPSALSTDDFSGTGRHAWSYTNGPPTSAGVFKLATVHGYDSETHTTASITYTIQFSSYNRNNVTVGDGYNCQPLITVMEIAG